MGVVLKGRLTIRKDTNSGVGNPLLPQKALGRAIKPWSIETKPGTTLANLEDAYLGTLADVDAVEPRDDVEHEQERDQPARYLAECRALEEGGHSGS